MCTHVRTLSCAHVLVYSKRSVLHLYRVSISKWIQPKNCKEMGSKVVCPFRAGRFTTPEGGAKGPSHRLRMPELRMFKNSNEDVRNPARRPQNKVTTEESTRTKESTGTQDMQISLSSTQDPHHSLEVPIW